MPQSRMTAAFFRAVVAGGALNGWAADLRFRFEG